MLEGRCEQMTSLGKLNGALRSGRTSGRTPEGRGQLDNGADDATAKRINEQRDCKNTEQPMCCNRMSKVAPEGRGQVDKDALDAIAKGGGLGDPALSAGEHDLLAGEPAPS